jgi:hypothetical protein
MPKLKVFQAHLGFFDTVVAAFSQKAALEAWGSRQDLFRDGTAAIATGPDAIKVALEKPGVVLKRLSGSTGAFLEQPPLPKSTGGHHRISVPRRPAQTIQKKPDRSKLEAVERALAKLQEERKRVNAGFAKREEALRNEQRARERDFEKRQSELERQIAQEKDAIGTAVRNSSSR